MEKTNEERLLEIENNPIELLKLMRDGGIKICEYALEQWMADKYKCGEKTRRAYIQEWSLKKDAITNLFNKLKTVL